MYFIGVLGLVYTLVSDIPDRLTIKLSQEKGQSISSCGHSPATTQTLQIHASVHLLFVRAH